MLSIVVFCLLTFDPLWSQDSLQIQEVVITGTRFELPVEQSGKTIYKITKQQIDLSKGKTVADLLNAIPGFHIDGNFGTPGTNLSYSSRGGRNRQIAILIDGILVADPSAINAFYDLRFLSLDEIESIEILKGGLSTLYGTSAATAVVNITLRAPDKNAKSKTIDLHGGSYGTVGGSGLMSGQFDRSKYLLSVDFDRSVGLSAASDEMSATSFDNDGYKQLNTLLKYGFQASPQWKVDIIGMYRAFSADYDDGAFSDADNNQVSKELRVGITPTYSYDKGLIRMQASHTSGDRNFISSFPVHYKSRNLQAELSQEHRWSDMIKGLWGVQLQQLSYSDVGNIDFSNAQITMIDPYASIVMSHHSGLNLHLGARLNTHSTYGSKMVYNINPSFLMQSGRNTRIKMYASISTAYITPSLFQLYAPFIGNTALTPEASFNRELGLAFYLNQALSINVVYFERNETNPIDFVSQFDDMGNYIGGQYMTAMSNRDINGIELDFKWKVNEQWNVNANYAIVNSDDEVSLYRLPKNKAGAAVQYQAGPVTSIRLDYIFTGGRKVFTYFLFSEVDLDAYQLVDLYVQHKLLKDQLTVYASINNLTNTDFVGVYGFTTRGRNFVLGMKLDL